MFIDFVVLMLLNMTAGLLILAAYLYKGLDDPDQGKWAPAFAMPGAVASLCGLRMAWTWPLPGSYNTAFGEMSVLFGVLFLGAALAQAKGWSLLPVALYAPVAGFAAVITGVRFIDLGLTAQPVMSGIGFILTGLGGVFAAPTVYWRRNRLLRMPGIAVMLAAAGIWALTGYLGAWGHLEAFMKWTPR